MIHKTKLLMVMFVSLFLLIGGGLFQSASAADQDVPPDLVVKPMQGEPGDQLTFYGSGFVPHEEVRVILESNDVPYVFGQAGTGGIVQANANGAFKLTPRGGIPRVMIEPGMYTIYAVGNKGSKASAPLEVQSKE